MREIKFRAYSPSSKNMQVIDIEKAANDIYIANHLMLLMADKHPEGKGLLMQFTGLKDRLGSEWYEGDAIYDRDDREAGVFIIEWCASHAQFVGHCHSDGEMLTLDEFEGFIVYGNIHQNPELLK